MAWTGEGIRPNGFPGRLDNGSPSAGLGVPFFCQGCSSRACNSRQGGGGIAWSSELGSVECGASSTERQARSMVICNICKETTIVVERWRCARHSCV